MQDKKTNNLEFFAAIAMILTILKLAGVISWSWLWILAPLWIPIGLALILLIIALLIGDTEG